MSDCILWTGRIAPNGYGTHGREYAHRLALTEKLGRPIRDGMDACHTCDNRACVNPNHLYEGTRRQNMADCTARGRHNKPHGEAHWSARLTTADVQQIRSLRETGALQRDIADRFGIHPSTVSRITRGIWRQEDAA